MLFNSLPFIFVFLPVVLLIHTLVRKESVWAASWLGIASLGFYGWWNWRFIGLLLGSIVINYFVGGRIAAADPSKRHWLAVGICFDLAVLAGFKYFGFLSDIVGVPLSFAIPLPLGISFYTFTQIAWLIDLARDGESRPTFRNYLLFVTWFPHLIAGPILHHREMIRQFVGPGAFRATGESVAAGVTLFCIGLAKKVLAADSIVSTVATVFDGTGEVGMLQSWYAAIGYSLQLYFDFSGYCDMAIGLSLLFGVRLPINFNSPYQTASIIDFWRRWHMTLSRFLREYLYIPLGGSRTGLRRYGNILITMALGGLWHGAGWNFLLWGVLHGLYLCANHLWRAGGLRLPGGEPSGRLLTLLAVVVAWVPFRAPNLHKADDILLAMAGARGLGQLDATMVASLAWVIALGWIALAAPNSQTIMVRARPTLSLPSSPNPTGLTWQMTAAWSVLAGVALGAVIVRLDQPSPFLYFQF